jgi:hypothetical protein
MKTACSIELYNYRVFVNEVAHINTVIKNANELNKIRLTQLTETKRYLEERIADIAARIQ